ncbi:MAG: PadR family transcriptional regulator [Thermocaproicibacter melissae]|jgi:PadR family transcriptional regulator, regulatory protein PadR|uniref:PadR family transcriptional regulator n=1 Tax=Thermocaproicibacter melissae TaxID=2966552 RepID=UPI0024B12D9E|nr:PadR family transcriptional regulator [Thermocaproicibacter melissae]WBY63600.1 PadR family transcriptional regulator [Thermocaproicibacter melissae]
MSGQMKKGILELCILHEVAKKESYGYEILNVIGSVFPGMDRSTVYAVLRRLNADGSTAVRIGDGESGGPQRKYYRITERGRAALRELTEEWNAVRSAAEKLGIT